MYENSISILIVPVVDHQLLNGQQGFVADVWILMGQQLHHELLATKLLNDTETKIISNSIS